MPYCLLQHTADLELQCWGESLAEVFQSAASGLVELLEARGEGREERQIELSAPELETLLVDWLTELLYLAEVEHLVPHAVSVDITEGWRLQGVIEFGRAEEVRPIVKAVTYHGLAVRMLGDTWTATVTLDA